MLLVLERVFDRQYASPRMTQQIEIVAIQAKCDTHLFDFLDEARNFPQRRFIGLVAVSRAKLIVVVVLN